MSKSSLTKVYLHLLCLSNHRVAVTTVCYCQRGMLICLVRNRCGPSVAHSRPRSDHNAPFQQERIIRSASFWKSNTFKRAKKANTLCARLQLPRSSGLRSSESPKAFPVPPSRSLAAIRSLPSEGIPICNAQSASDRLLPILQKDVYSLALDSASSQRKPSDDHRDDH